MDNTFHYPRDLAKYAHKCLTQSQRKKLSVALLTEVIETAYFASMRTEESHGITCTIAVLDYEKPDTPPPLIRPQRAQIVPFAEKLPYTVRMLTKLAQAADPASTCIAVAVKPDRELCIIGLIDQEVHHRNLVHYEKEAANFGRHGLLQIEVTGVGTLSVYDDKTMIAGLTQNNLVTNFVDVFTEGPILQLLRPYIRKFREEVRGILGEVYDRECWFSIHENRDVSVEKMWLGTLCRILLAIQRYGHGGALLLQPTLSLNGLNVKYRIDYCKLREVMPLDTANDILQQVCWWDIHDDYCENNNAPMPPQLHLSHVIAGNDREDAIEAEEGAVDFIASLSRVDGLVLMTEGLQVRGFGVEITVKNDPPTLYISKDAKAKVRDLKKGDLNHFGTRHRSMMRYCYANPGSIGFVVSQDGDVRAVTRRGAKLLLWENVRLLNIDQTVASSRRGFTS